MCLLCDPPRPGRREDTYSTTPQAAATIERNRTVYSRHEERYGLDAPTRDELDAD